MSFGTSETYIYAYIAFASVYLIASLTFVARALRVGTGLSRSRQLASDEQTPASAGAVNALIGHGQRVIDYTQLATLLPLVYIVGSMFLGSVITHDLGLARAVNVGWVLFTAACAVAIVFLAVLGIRESGELGHSRPAGALTVSASDAVQRIGARLSVSAALLLLVAVFTMLNLWSVVSSLDALSAIDFLL